MILTAGHRGGIAVLIGVIGMIDSFVAPSTSARSSSWGAS
jgi:hypothetical protein